ncbi:MAG: hypothetical protein IJ679_11090 [Lachnospiraceae bacterium]|nr:hypothetical protein [Lachnospiraceae bacterium]
MRNKRLVLIGNNKGMETLCNFFCVRPEIKVVGLVHSSKTGSELTAQKYADKYEISRIFHPRRKDQDQYLHFLSKIRNLHPDLAICYSYDRIFDEDFLSIFNGEVYNLHGAMLPKYRGQNVLNWVLINGEESTGMTLHKVNLGIDSGPIVYQKEIKINFEDTAVTLKNKMDSKVLEILESFLPDIVSNAIKTKDQDETLSTYFHKRYPSDGKIDWNKPALDIYNLIRALVTPWPGAYYIKDNKKYVINSFMKLEDVEKMQKEMNYLQS